MRQNVSVPLLQAEDALQKQGMQQPAPKAICLTSHQRQSIANRSTKLTSTAHLLMQPLLSDFRHLVHCTTREASRHKCLAVQPTFEGFHGLKVPRHSSINGLCVPFKGVITLAAAVGTGFAGLLPSLDLVAGDVDGAMYMGQAVHQSTIILARDGVPAVHHSVAAADQPPAGDGRQITGNRACCSCEVLILLLLPPAAAMVLAACRVRGAFLVLLHD